MEWMAYAETWGRIACLRCICLWFPWNPRRNIGNRFGERWNDTGGRAAPAGAEEGFSRRRTTGETAGGPGADSELRARSRTATVAHGDAPQAPVDAPPGADAQPTGELVGRGPY